MQLEQNLRHFGVLYESHIFWNYTCLYFPYFYKTTHTFIWFRHAQSHTSQLRTCKQVLRWRKTFHPSKPFVLKWHHLVATWRTFVAFIWKKHVQKYFCTKYFRWGHWLAFTSVYSTVLTNACFVSCEHIFFVRNSSPCSLFSFLAYFLFSRFSGTTVATRADKRGKRGSNSRPSFFFCQQ